MSDVTVVIGVGGMGEAIARRTGSGKRVLLADFNPETLNRVAESLTGDGLDIVTQSVDVSSPESVTELAATAASLGEVRQVSHTAGLSPAQASTAAILAVDLAGVAFVLEEFEKVIAPNGAAVVIASMAATLFEEQLPPDVVTALTYTPARELLDLPCTRPDRFSSPGMAYGFSKRANQVRVRAASRPWGERRARVNSISPGVISTPMGRLELASESGQLMRLMVEKSGTSRLGTPYDVAAAAAFLLGPDASFITGTDLLVDGGATAAVKSGAPMGDRTDPLAARA